MSPRGPQSTSATKKPWPQGAVGNSTDAKTYPVSWRVFSSFSRKALISSPVTSLNVM